MEHIIYEAGFAAEDCFHYSVQGGAELDMVTTANGSRFGFEFKHGDIPKVTRSMHEAADDLNVKRVFQVYPGADTFGLESSGRFLALAWQDLPSLHSRME